MNDARDSFPKAKHAYSTPTDILRRTFKAQSYNCRSYYTNNTSYICYID